MYIYTVRYTYVECLSNHVAGPGDKAKEISQASLKQVKLTGQPAHDKKYIPEAVKVFRDAMQIEDKAIKETEKYLCDYINNKNYNPSRLKHLY